MGPIINNPDNSYFYCPGNEPVKNDPMKWNHTWYLNNKIERM